MDRDFENVIEHSVWVDPYVGGHKMKKHVTDMFNYYEHLLNDTSPIEFATVQGIIDGFERSLGAKHVLRDMCILSPYHSNFTVMRPALNGIYPNLNVPGDRLFD